MVIRQSDEPGINAFRFVLMFTVVLAHSWFLFGTPVQRGNPTFFLLVTAQCSVPAFFIISGYFLRWREADRFAVTRWAVRKLLPLYVMWIAFYAFVTWFSGWGAIYTVSTGIETGRGLLQLLRDVAFGASTRHLWFLPALALALSITSLSLRFAGERRTWIIASALAGVGLLTGPYQMFLGLEGHSVRAQFLTGPLLVLFGIHIAGADAPRRPLVFALAMLVAYWLQVLDDRWLATAPGFAITKSRTAVTFATIPFALTAFLFARSLRKSSFLEFISRRKHYLLVIYCIHPMMLRAVNGVWGARSLSAMLLAAVVGYGLSLLAAILLSVAHRRWRERGRADDPTTVVSAQPEASPVATRG